MSGITLPLLGLPGLTTCASTLQGLPPFVQHAASRAVPSAPVHAAAKPRAQHVAAPGAQGVVPSSATTRRMVLRYHTSLDTRTVRAADLVDFLVRREDHVQATHPSSHVTSTDSLLTGLQRVQFAGTAHNAACRQVRDDLHTGVTCLDRPTPSDSDHCGNARVPRATTMDVLGAWTASTRAAATANATLFAEWSRSVEKRELVRRGAARLAMQNLAARGQRLDGVRSGCRESALAWRGIVQRHSQLLSAALATCNTQESAETKLDKVAMVLERVDTLASNVTQHQTRYQLYPFRVQPGADGDDVLATEGGWALLKSLARSRFARRHPHQTHTRGTSTTQPVVLRRQAPEHDVPGFPGLSRRDAIALDQLRRRAHNNQDATAVDSPLHTVGPASLSAEELQSRVVEAVRLRKRIENDPIPTTLARIALALDENFLSLCSKCDWASQLALSATAAAKAIQSLPTSPDAQRARGDTSGPQQQRRTTQGQQPMASSSSPSSLSSSSSSSSLSSTSCVFSTPSAGQSSSAVSTLSASSELTNTPHSFVHQPRIFRAREKPDVAAASAPCHIISTKPDIAIQAIDDTASAQPSAAQPSPVEPFQDNCVSPAGVDDCAAAPECEPRPLPCVDAGVADPRPLDKWSDSETESEDSALSASSSARSGLVGCESGKLHWELPTNVQEFYRAVALVRRRLQRRAGFASLHRDKADRAIDRCERVVRRIQLTDKARQAPTDATLHRGSASSIGTFCSTGGEWSDAHAPTTLGGSGSFRVKRDGVVGANHAPLERSRGLNTRLMIHRDRSDFRSHDDHAHDVVCANDAPIGRSQDGNTRLMTHPASRECSDVRSHDDHGHDRAVISRLQQQLGTAQLLLRQKTEQVGRPLLCTRPVVTLVYCTQVARLVAVTEIHPAVPDSEATFVGPTTSKLQRLRDSTTTIIAELDRVRICVQVSCEPGMPASHCISGHPESASRGAGRKAVRATP